jgi:phosphatidylglycerophosphate synthase
METRENNGLLAAAEKRVLVWLAERMPSRVNSDHLTALAATGMLICAAGFVAGARHPAALPAVVGGLIVNWFGDSLDGTLARVRDCQRPRYGYYVDHVLDAAGTLVLFAALAISGFMTPIVALVLLTAYYLVSIEVYLATHALGRFRMSFWKVGPTELRIVLAVGALRLMSDPFVTIAGSEYLLFDLAGVIASVGLAVTAVLSAASNARALYRLEPVSGTRIRRTQGTQ